MILRSTAHFTLFSRSQRPHTFSLRRLPFAYYHQQNQQLLQRRYATTPTKYENILVEVKGSVGFITLNRPKALNALNEALMYEVIDALRNFDADTKIGCIVLTGLFF
jgi:hypothetical protein